MTEHEGMEAEIPDNKLNRFYRAGYNAAVEDAAKVADRLASAVEPLQSDPEKQLGLPYFEAKRMAEALSRVAAAIRALKEGHNNDE